MCSYLNARTRSRLPSRCPRSWRDLPRWRVRSRCPYQGGRSERPAVRAQATSQGAPGTRPSPESRWRRAPRIHRQAAWPMRYTARSVDSAHRVDPRIPFGESCVFVANSTTSTHAVHHGVVQGGWRWVYRTRRASTPNPTYGPTTVGDATATIDPGVGVAFYWGENVKNAPPAKIRMVRFLSNRATSYSPRGSLPKYHRR